MAHAKSGKVVKIDESDLLCKNGCGFYGNPAWQGFCSKCWREVYHTAKHAQQSHDVTAHTSSKVPPDRANVTSFTKFEEKVKQHSGKRRQTVKSIFKKQTQADSSQSSQLTQGKEAKVQRQASIETLEAGKELTDFLKTLDKELALEISKEVRSVILDINRLGGIPIEDYSDFVVGYYQRLSDNLNMHPVHKDLPESTILMALDLTERYLCTRCYTSLFSPTHTNDEELDLVLQDRIRKLHWVNGHLLDSQINEGDEEVKKYLDSAITEIIQVNSCRAPQDKLAHIVTCSQNIFESLRATKQAPASADEYLPALIYIVLKANPPMLHSNIQFITRFSNPSRLMSGETGYYFTNLCCAVAFIQKMSAESLNMSQEDFDKYMTGELLPYNPFKIYNCEGLEILNEAARTLEEVSRKQQDMLMSIRALNTHRRQFGQDFKAKIDSVLARTPLTLRPPKTKVDMDADTPSTEDLPPPLVPMTVEGRHHSGAVADDTEEDLENLELGVEMHRELGENTETIEENVKSPLENTENVEASSVCVNEDSVEDTRVCQNTPNIQGQKDVITEGLEVGHTT